MRTVLSSVVAVSLLAAVMTAPASAQRRHSCGNYGYPKGYSGENPIFTDKPIVGAGVEDIHSDDRDRLLKFRFGA